jgi:hypothetical protein
MTGSLWTGRIATTAGGFGDLRGSGLARDAASAAELALPYVGDEPRALGLVAVRVRSAANLVRELCEELHGLEKRLSSAWSGRAAVAAQFAIRRTRLVADGCAGPMGSAASAIEVCEEELTRVRDRVDAARSRWLDARALDEASEDAGFLLAAAGVAAFDALEPSGEDMRMEAITWWRSAAGEAREATRRCDLLLRAAEQDLVEPATSGALAGAANSTSALFPSPSVPSNADPVAVALEWQGLSDNQRDALIREVPAVLGALDGLPVTIRDRANRFVLNSVKAELASLAGAEAGTGNQRPASGDADIRRWASDQLAALDALTRILDVREPPRFLLAFDAGNENHVSVAIGDPDTAEAVGVLVPGTGSNLRQLPGLVDRAVALRAAAASTRPESVGPVSAPNASGGTGTPSEASSPHIATVLWLDYDAPQTLKDAADVRFADQGAAALTGLLAGLRVSHRAPRPAVVTLLVHSYAGLLAGRAASRTSLAADQLVFLGSTGTRTTSVDDLQLAGVPVDQRRNRVFAITSTADPISVSAAVHSGLPQDPEFGARSTWVSDPGPDIGDIPLSAGVLAARTLVPGVNVLMEEHPSMWWDVDAHSGYWEEGGKALALQGAIIARRLP